MLIPTPRPYNTRLEHETCPYHQRRPEDQNYAGCTCSSTVSQVPHQKDCDCERCKYWREMRSRGFA